MIRDVLAKYKLMPVQIKASFFFLLCSFFQKGISMITTPIFTRIMTTSEYGQFGVFNSWYGILSIIVALSLSGGIHVQGIVKFEEEKNSFSNALIGLTTVLLLAWFFIYQAFRAFWNSIFSLTTIHIVMMFVIIWANAIFCFWANEQRAKYAYKVLVSVTLVSALLRSIIEIGLVLASKDKATARIIGWAIADFLSFGWIIIAKLKEGTSFFSKKYWLYAISYNLPLIPHYLSQTVLNSADRIMIQKMEGDSQAGIYNLAYSVSLIMTMFNNALMQTINPWMYKKIKENKGKEIGPIAYSTLIFVASVNIVLMIFAPEIIAVFAPSSYHEAVLVIPPIAMSVYFMYSYDLFAKFAFYYEKTTAIAVASTVGAILNIFLNYIFVQKYGYLAAGYTTLACYIVYAISHYIIMLKTCKDYCNGNYPYDIKRILAITITFIILGFVILASYKNVIIRLSLIGILAIVLITMKKRIIQTLSKIIKLKSGV
ncbi:oligosaccharide flippase family protein [Butyrivibrio sp. MC2021]|uniref:oligosaccharide flippase family protein n=1 Tax=Butyrivibrio sp. MC2021 TaxID=1408306 RepID=UPI00047DB13F|nr:oligosaccharide flippase family protein [Butyrivibrio sp. MC2021]